MAIPDRPLNFRPEDMELGDFWFLEEWLGSQENTAAQLRVLVDILARCSDWTAEEMRHLRVSELAEVLKMMKVVHEKEVESSVPFPTVSS